MSSKTAASGGDRQHGAVRAEDGRALDSTQLPSGTEDGTDQRPIDRPQADPSSRYHSILQESAKTYPFATEALMRSDRHRPRRWQQFIDAIDLQAIELLLTFLASASGMLAENSETSDLYFLPTRVADDVRMSLEGLLSGYLQVSSDATRDMMESELLIRDFAYDPRQIRRWRDADEDVLRRQFRPVNLRQRQAQALGVPVTEVPGATDYKAHSMLLHVRPPLLFPRSPESGHQAIYVLDALSEIMFHGQTTVEALVALFDAVDLSAPDSSTTLSALRSSKDDINTARAATVGLGIAMK